MNIKRIIPFFCVPLGLFVFHVVIDFGFGLYEVFPWIDIPMHFFGGAAIAIFIFGIYKELLRSSQVAPMPLYIELAALVGQVALFAVVWEFAEFLVDAQFGTMWQPSLADTMFDLFNGLLGGAITGAFFLREQKKRSST